MTLYLGVFPMYPLFSATEDEELPRCHNYAPIFFYLGRFSFQKDACPFIQAALLFLATSSTPVLLVP